MVLPAAAAMPVPAGWSPEQALGLVVNWPTALAALRPLGRVAAGETVLIGAAAGATGQAAVTLAKHYGATVIAAAAASKHETVRALGADHVVDSRSEDLAAEVLDLTGGIGADLVLESGGGALHQPGRGQAGHRPRRRLRPGRRRSRDHQLGAGVQAPGPRHRAQHRRADRSRTPALRRAHGRAVGASSPPASSPPLAPRRTTWPTARRRSRTWPPAPRSASWPCDPDRGDARPVRHRDRTVPPGAAGALLPDGRFSP